VSEENPKQDAGPPVEAESTPVQAEEKFPRGTIVRFFPQSRYGFIKDRLGRDVYFNLEEVRFVGEKGIRDIQEGQSVGYDVGWTSHGLHVTVLKIY
jgi:cold shock CspA family protein